MPACDVWEALAARCRGKPADEVLTIIRDGLLTVADQLDADEVTPDAIVEGR